MPKLIKTFEEACKVKGIDPASIETPGLPDEFRKPMVAAAKLLIIIDVLNEGHKFDWTNYDEYKYFPWWDMNDTSSPSGFGLSDVDCDLTASNVGSRFVFRTRKLAEHAAKHFIDLYRDLMTQ